MQYIQVCAGGSRPLTEQMASALGYNEQPRRFAEKHIEHYRHLDNAQDRARKALRDAGVEP